MHSLSAISNGARNKNKNPRNIILKLKAHQIWSPLPNNAGSIVYFYVSIFLQISPSPLIYLTFSISLTISVFLALFLTISVSLTIFISSTSPSAD
jgi:hypothetical protein